MPCFMEMGYIFVAFRTVTDCRCLTGGEFTWSGMVIWDPAFTMTGSGTE